eukprot:3534153-Alexandrium_andersonii.AAC.1
MDRRRNQEDWQDPTEASDYCKSAGYQNLGETPALGLDRTVPRLLAGVQTDLERRVRQGGKPARGHTTAR